MAGPIHRGKTEVRKGLSEMGTHSGEQTTQGTKVATLPITCASGHQIYLVYFPNLDAFGFGCPTCHVLGKTVYDHLTTNRVRKGKAVLYVKVNRGPLLKDLDGDLLLWTEQKAEKITCAKGHQIGVMNAVAEGVYGFFCDHCKLYALEVDSKGRTLSIAVRNEDGSQPTIN